MKQQGDKKIRYKLEGHGDCGICIPPIKNRRYKAKEEARKDIEEQLIEYEEDKE